MRWGLRCLRRIGFKARYVSAVGVKEPPAALDLGRATLSAVDAKVSPVD